MGRHQRRRRRGRGGAAGRGRPRALPRRLAGRDRDREGRHHQARRGRGARPAGARRGRGAAARGSPRSARRVAREGDGVRRDVAGCPRSAARWSRCRGCAGGTTSCSSRCTARTRPRTPPSRWRRSRRSWAASEPLDDELVRAAFAEVTSPGRLEIVRTGPTIVLDAAHNPHGAEATAAALEDSFTLDPLIGVIGLMADKDAEGLLAAFEPHLAHVVVHPELHRARAAGRRAGRGRDRGVRRGPGHRRAAAGRRDRPGGRAGRGGSAARRSAPAGCW